MPKVISIEWAARVQIFLAYRLRRQKVYPVAKRYKIARSTVRRIVEEFREAGFSGAPRPSLSPEMLGRAQEAHLGQWIGWLKEPRLHHPPGPELQLQSGVAMSGVHAGEEGDVPAREAGIVPSPIGWHLRGTPTGDTVSEANIAVDEYYDSCQTLWNDLAETLESSSGLSMRPIVEREVSDDAPRIFDALVDLIYTVLYRDPRWSPPGDWPRWSAADDSPILRANHQHVADGEPSDHQAVREAVAQFLSHSLEDYRRRAAELQRLHRDLGYLTEVVAGTLKSVTDARVRAGICPECPFPEIVFVESLRDAGSGDIGPDVAAAR